METKTCSKCQIVKPLHEFYKKWATKNVYQPICKLCTKAVNSANHKRNINYRHDQQHEWYRKKVLEDPEWHLKKRAERFKITLDEARRIWEPNICAICGIGSCAGRGYLVFDHSHQKPGIRGLLCNCCNWMLGHAKDNPEWLRKGAEYLEKQAA